MRIVKQWLHHLTDNQATFFLIPEPHDEPVMLWIKVTSKYWSAFSYHLKLSDTFC